MSAPPASRTGSVSGPSAAGANGPHHQSTGSNAGPQGQQQPASAQQPQQTQNLNQIVLEYLNKKGFNRSEAMLRRESRNVDSDGHPVVERVEESGGAKFSRAFELMNTWIEENLDIYKPELRRFKWPVFVYSIIEMARGFFAQDCDKFYDTYSHLFEMDHPDDLRALKTVRFPEHVPQSKLVQLYMNNKYRLTLTSVAFANLIGHLESREDDGGTVILHLISTYLHVVGVSHTSTTERDLAALLEQNSEKEAFPTEEDGIPGHNAGSANTDPNAPAVLAKLSLGHAPADQDFIDDVRAQLQEEDDKVIETRQPTYVEEFELKLKRESAEAAPSRDLVPIPPLMARDVALEVQRVKENRDRFKLDGKTGGVGPGVSVAMYTLMNTNDSVNCLDISGDYRLLAAGTSESYIRVWTMTGETLHQPMGGNTSLKPSNSRVLIGHAGPVYQVAFSPGTQNPETSTPNPPDTVGPEDRPSTHPRFLLSCSGDGTIRLWSVDVWAQLVTYKSHVGPVWDIAWDKHGHYFCSAGHDRSARIWTTDSISPHRYLVGHEDDVDHVAFHPNGAYFFTSSSDKTVRMWDSRGHSVRMFSGHSGNPTALACSPDGFSIASGDDAGHILIFNLVDGRLTRRLRGHGRGGIWSLSWSVESSILVSGGADGTVRSWDMLMDTAKDGAAAKGAQGDAATGLKGDNAGTSAAVATSGSTGSGAAAGSGAGGAGSGAGNTAGGGKKNKGKQRDNVVSPEQISAFPTKKSPVYKVLFTHSNLILAGGAYLPDTM